MHIYKYKLDLRLPNVKSITDTVPGLPPTGTKKIPDFSLTVKQFSLTVQDDYFGSQQK